MTETTSEGPQAMFQRYYNSPDLSDVTILSPPRILGRADDGSEDSSIHAHKIILAAGSKAFRDYFTEHPQDAGSPVHRIKIGDVCFASYGMTRLVLRHLYGLDTPEDDALRNPSGDPHSDRVYCCDTADMFGVPSLRKLAMSNSEDLLRSKLGSEVIVDDDGPTSFAEDVESIFDDQADGETSAVEVALKLCCEFFSELQKNSDFQNFMESRPEWCKLMLDYAGRNGLSFLKKSD